MVNEETFYSTGQATDDILRHHVFCITKAIDTGKHLSVTFYVCCLSCFFIIRHSLRHLCSNKETEERSDHDSNMTASYYRTSIGSVEGQ